MKTSSFLTMAVLVVGMATACLTMASCAKEDNSAGEVTPDYNQEQSGDWSSWLPTGEKQFVEVEEEATCIKVISEDMVDAAWDTQFWLLFDQEFAEGDSWEVSMRVRADKECDAGTQTHNAPGEYIHWAGIGTVHFTTEWTDYIANGTITAEQNGGFSIAFNLNDFADANTYYFDHLSFKLNGQELISNGNCDDPNGTANYRTKESRGPTVDSRIVDKIIVKKEVDGGSSARRK